MDTWFDRVGSARVALAAFVAPLMGVFALVAGIGAWNRFALNRDWILLDTQSSSALVLLLGYAIGLLAEVLIGAPAYWWLQRTRRLHVVWVTVAGAVAGAITVNALWSLLGRNLDVRAMMQFSLVGALPGGAAGASFWVIAFAHFRANRAAI